MPKRADPYKLLRQAANSFATQTQFIIAAKNAYEEVHVGLRQGPRARANDIQVFKVITEYRLKCIRQDKVLPSNRATAKHLELTYGFSESRAKVYVGIWKRWCWRGVATLTPQDQAWLKKNYGSVAKPFFSRSWLRNAKSRQKHSAQVKAREDLEMDRLIDELRSECWKLNPPKALNNPQMGQVYKYMTRADVLKLLRT